MDSLEREQARLAAEEDATLAKLLRLRKQQRFLHERRSRMIREGFENVEQLEAAEAAGAGGPSDPEIAKEGRSPKRLRGESSANTFAGPARTVGSPGAGSGAAPPEASELVDQARWTPDFNFGSLGAPSIDASLAWVDLGFSDGILQ